MSSKIEANRRRFYSLDSLRGIGAFSIVLGHYGANLGTTFVVSLDYFFILSGFVISHSYFWNPKISLGKFFLIRLARMYPLHILTALILIFYEFLIKPEYRASMGDIALHVFFIQNMGFGPERNVLNVPSWSISAEFWINILVYILLIAFLKVNGLKRYSRGIIFISALFFALLGYLFLINHVGSLAVDEEEHFGFMNLGLLRCSTGFLWGMFIYTLYDNFLKSWKPFNNNYIPAILLSIYLFLLFGPYGNSKLDYLCPLFFAVMILYLAKDHSSFSDRLGKFSYFGDISFSIYLIHYMLLIFSWNFAYLEISKFVMNSILMVTTFTLSALCYRYYEVPAYKYLRSQIMSYDGNIFSNYSPNKARDK